MPDLYTTAQAAQEMGPSDFPGGTSHLHLRPTTDLLDALQAALHRPFVAVN